MTHVLPRRNVENRDYSSIFSEVRDHSGVWVPQFKVSGILSSIRQDVVVTKPVLSGCAEQPEPS